MLELQRAWRAIRAGRFSGRVRRQIQVGEWTSAEPVVPVLGVHGQCGASTVALALATVAAPARVAECASGPACGLIGAPTAELGVCGGWMRGVRADVVVDRSPGIVVDATEVPLPADVDRPVDRTIVDVGWEPTHVLSVSCWLSSLLLTSPCVVLVATVSVPGLRRLENTLDIVTTPACVAAVVGPPPRRWPTSVAGSIGTRTRRLVETRRLVSVPTIGSLRLTGITGDPLPRPLLSAAGDILRIAEDLTPGPTGTRKDV